MVVFQYGNNIYYRAVRDIPAGTELLVWYNNNYTQFLGVPFGLRNVPGTKKGQENNSLAQRGPKSPTSTVTQDDVKPFIEQNNPKNNHSTTSGSKTPEVVYSSRHMQTKTTYCYPATSPAGLPPSVKFSNEPSTKNLSMVQPTVTIGKYMKSFI